jgi:hypothetical protein
MIDTGVDARKPFPRREARQVAAMLLHPRAETLPEGARLVLG